MIDKQTNKKRKPQRKWDSQTELGFEERNANDDENALPETICDPQLLCAFVRFFLHIPSDMEFLVSLWFDFWCLSVWCEWGVIAEMVVVLFFFAHCHDLKRKRRERTLRLARLLRGLGCE